MNNKHYVGKRISSFELYDEVGPITGVALVVDEENEHIAGNDTGYMIEVFCPYGTQTMADNILSQLAGKTYKGFSSTGAALSPDAELGDAITIDGTYSFLAHQNINFGPGHFSDVSAPGESVMEHEYGWKSPEQKEIDRKLAVTRSLIAKTAEEVLLRVEAVEGEISKDFAEFKVRLDGIEGIVSSEDGEFAKMKLTLDGLTIEGTDGTTRIKGSSIDTSTLTVTDIIADGSITWKMLDTKQGSNLYNIDQRSISAKSAVDGWCYGNTTYIDGSQIMTGTVTASELYGEYIGMYTYDDWYEEDVECGYLYVRPADTADYAIELHSYGGLELSSEDGAVFISNGDLWLETGYDIHNAWLCYGDFAPWGDWALGTASLKWDMLYALDCTCCTSDRNTKHDISYDMSRYAEMFSHLKPASFKRNNGKSGRTHVGFIAQDFEEAMTAAGISDMEYAALIKNDAGYGLRYGEVTALNTYMIQQLQKEIEELKGRIS